MRCAKNWQKFYNANRLISDQTQTKPFDFRPNTKDCGVLKCYAKQHA